MTQTRSKQIRKNRETSQARSGFMQPSRPEGMVLEVLPVIPPDLRRRALEGGRLPPANRMIFIRVITGITGSEPASLKTPDVIIRNESGCSGGCRRPLSNGRHGRAVTAQAIGAQVALGHAQGQRADVSARICSANASLFRPLGDRHRAELSLSADSEEDALVLSSLHHRRLKNLATSILARAKKMIERQTPEVWDILDEVTKAIQSCSTAHDPPSPSIQAVEPH